MTKPTMERTVPTEIQIVAKWWKKPLPQTDREERQLVKTVAAALKLAPPQNLEQRNFVLKRALEIGPSIVKEERKLLLSKHSLGDEAPTRRQLEMMEFSPEEIDEVLERDIEETERKLKEEVGEGVREVAPEELKVGRVVDQLKMAMTEESYTTVQKLLERLKELHSEHEISPSIYNKTLTSAMDWLEENRENFRERSWNFFFDTIQNQILMGEDLEEGPEWQARHIERFPPEEIGVTEEGKPKVISPARPEFPEEVQELLPKTPGVRRVEGEYEAYWKPTKIPFVEEDARRSLLESMEHLMTVYPGIFSPEDFGFVDKKKLREYIIEAPSDEFATFLREVEQDTKEKVQFIEDESGEEIPIPSKDEYQNAAEDRLPKAPGLAKQFARYLEDVGVRDLSEEKIETQLKMFEMERALRRMGGKKSEKLEVKSERDELINDLIDVGIEKSELLPLSDDLLIKKYWQEFKEELNFLDRIKKK